MKRYTPIIESDSSCDMFASIEETINGTLVKYSEVEQLQADLKNAFSTMEYLWGIIDDIDTYGDMADRKSVV